MIPTRRGASPGANQQISKPSSAIRAVPRWSIATTWWSLRAWARAS